MGKMHCNKITFGVAMLAAAVLGYCLHPSTERAPELKEVPKRPVPLLPDKGESAKVAALRLQVRDLESRLAESQRNVEGTVSNALARAAAQRFDRPPPGGPGREWLDRLRQQDPVKFAQATNRFAKMHQERKRRQESRALFLSSVSTAGMSAKEKETHDEYQKLLARREELEDEMRQPDMSEDARHNLMEEIREVDHEMRTLGASERKTLLGEIAQAIGMEGDAATELVETVGDVIDATEAGHGPPGPPPF